MVLWELQQLRKGTVDLARAMGGLNKFIFNLGYVDVIKTKLSKERRIAESGNPHQIQVNNTMNDKFDLWSAVHELGHVWDHNFNWLLSDGLVTFTGGATDPSGNLPAGYVCDIDPTDPRKLKHKPDVTMLDIYMGESQRRALMLILIKKRILLSL